MLDILTFVLLSIVICLILQKYLKWCRDMEHLNRIPGPKCRSLIFGNLDMFWERGKPLNHTIGQRLMGFAQVYKKEKIFKFWIGWKPIVCVFTPDHFQDLLGKYEQIQKPDDSKTVKLGLGVGLGTAETEDWHRNRKLLMPSFNSKIFNNFLPIFNKHSLTFQKFVAENNGYIGDIEKICKKTTLDIICETAMGVRKTDDSDSNFEEAATYANSLKMFTKILVKRIFTPWLQPDVIFFNTSIGKEMMRQTKIMHDFTDRVIQERKRKLSDDIALQKNNNNNNDVVLKNPIRREMIFLDFLLNLNMAGLMSENQIRDEVTTFTMAGHDTVGVTTSFSLFSIGSHPDVQEKIHAELDEVFGNDYERDVEVQDVRKLVYLEMVIKETLRLFSPAPTMGRKLTEDVILGEYFIPKGTDVWFVIQALHHNEEIYPDPIKFIPERFQNSRDINQYSWGPFSAGRRNCPGNRFAMVEAKVILANILRRYRIESLDPLDQLFITFELILRSKTPIRMKFYQRFPDANRSTG